MGKRGPQKTPAIVKLARGTYRKDRDGDPATAPQFAPAVIGNPPAELGERGKATWLELGPKLAGQGLLTEVDVLPFARYCRALDEVIRLDALLVEQGEYFQTEQGYVGQHPAVNQRFKWLAEINRFESRFGMQASDRCGLQVGAKKAGLPTRSRAQ